MQLDSIALIEFLWEVGKKLNRNITVATIAAWVTE